MGNIHFCLDNTTWILGKPSYQPSQMVLQCCNETTYGHFSIKKTFGDEWGSFILGHLKKNNNTITMFFFRPTPLGFRQVVQHVRLHVA